MYNSGDFSFIQSDYEREMLVDAYSAISVTNSWEAMAQEVGPGGFMFTNPDYLKPITKAMKYTGHSGSSMSLTLRAMQYIAINGWDNYVKAYLDNNNNPNTKVESNPVE